MPFKSYAQYRYLMKFHPDIARRWVREGHRVPKRPKNYRSRGGAKTKQRDLSAHTDPVALKALRIIHER